MVISGWTIGVSEIGVGSYSCLLDVIVLDSERGPGGGYQFFFLDFF